MVDTGVRIQYILCGVVYLSSVMGADLEYILDIQNGSPKRTHVTVPVTSVVTLVCQDRFRTNRVTWYKAWKTYVANMSYVNGICNLNNDNYHSITLGPHECKGGNFSITFSRIRVADQGAWYCTDGRSSSNLVEISVVESPTLLLTASTRKKPTLSMTFTYSRPIPPTVSAHTKPTLITVYTHTKPTLITVSNHIKYTMTTVATPLRQSTTAFLPASPSETPGVGPKEPKKHVNVTEENMKTEDNIPLIAATVGGIVASVIIITMVIALVPKGRHSEKSTDLSCNDATYDDVNVESPPPGNRSTEGGNRRQGTPSVTNYSIPSAVNREYENMYDRILRGNNGCQSEPRGDETGTSV